MVTLQITASLEGAIRNLQGDEESVTLWADAICINQSDDIEKSGQVQQLKDIYESASDVVVWLGPASHDSDMGMDTLAQHGKEAADMDLHQISTKDINNWSEPNATALSKHIGKFVHEMALRHGLELPTMEIQGIFYRPWFQRVWILQEVSVARDPVFVCGKKRISMSHLTAAIFFYEIYVMEILKPLQEGTILGPEERSTYQKFLEKLHTTTAGTVIGGRRKYKGELGGPESLFQLLYRTNVVTSSLERLEATVDKDRVYALLGISKDALELGIMSDYSKSCQRVYIDTTAALLEHGYLDVLALRQFPKKYPELPSWVPDWTAQIHVPCGGLRQSAKYEACGKTEHSVIISSLANDLDIAAITGSVIDKVTGVGVPWLPVPQAPNFDWAACSLLLSEIEAFCKESDRLGHDIYNEPRQRIEAVWRTPFADQRFLNITGICRASCGGKEILDDYKLIKETASSIQKAMILLDDYKLKKETASSVQKALDNVDHNAIMDTWRSQAVIGGMFNRRPFISALGYVGLAPSHSEPGDTLCIFHGAIVPYVIRKGEHGRYRLVVYVLTSSFPAARRALITYHV